MKKLTPGSLLMNCILEHHIDMVISIDNVLLSDIIIRVINKRGIRKIIVNEKTLRSYERYKAIETTNE